MKNKDLILAVLGRVVITAVALLCVIPVFSQRATATATIEPTEIMIGEQALLDLKVIAPKDKIIHFPVYDKEIVPGVEVIAMLPPDTLIENDVMTLNFKYVVTSFDSTLYYVPYVPIYDGTDTVYSNSFGLKVVSPELSDSTLAYLEKINTGQTDSIDFEQLRLYDIKPVIEPPFVWTDYLWILWLVLGVSLVLALIGVAIYLIRKKRDKGYIFKPPVVLPAHVRAIEDLDKLKSEKIWQQGREKEFYVQLTDILRRYLYEREGINAMEMTSGEILTKVKEFSEIDPVYDNLKQILTTADLVKFAKYKPLMNENDLSMDNAYLFVDKTKETDDLEESGEGGDNEAVDDNKEAIKEEN